MGNPAARQGDLTTHGGTITVGFPTVMIGAMPAARLGDMHTCPMVTPGTPPVPHVGGPIMLGSAPLGATIATSRLFASIVGDAAGKCFTPADSSFG